MAHDHASNICRGSSPLHLLLKSKRNPRVVQRTVQKPAFLKLKL